MDEWQVIVARSAEKDLRRLGKRERQAAREAFMRLPAGDTKKLKGASPSFRLRVGGIRVLFDIDRPSRIVNILHVFHRSQGYRA